MAKLLYYSSITMDAISALCLVHDALTIVNKTAQYSYIVNLESAYIVVS